MYVWDSCGPWLEICVPFFFFLSFLFFLHYSYFSIPCMISPYGVKIAYFWTDEGDGSEGGEAGFLAGLIICI